MKRIDEEIASDERKHMNREDKEKLVFSLLGKYEAGIVSQITSCIDPEKGRFSIHDPLPQ